MGVNVGEDLAPDIGIEPRGGLDFNASTRRHMRVVVEESPGGVARRAADIVENYLQSTPAPVLGLATGDSVRLLYRQLVRRFQQGQLSFAGVRAFLLDEYIGIEPGHPQRFRNVIEAEFAGHVDLDPAHLYSPDGDAPDLKLECARYERLVTRAGVGLQILGIGRNGHLAFNEPGSSFASRTRVVRLADVTRADNARCFGGTDHMPSHAITQGIATMGHAAHLLLVATGSHKSEAVRAALNGPIASAVPASALRLFTGVTVLLDPLAARLASLPTS